jgi:glucosamine--fructose-6-phosphate aminotransferase (isomerizing)
MVSGFPAYGNIMDQPAALAQVLQVQWGQGSAALERAAAQIREAPRVVVAAMGASYAASLAFCYRMAGGSTKVILEDAAELLHYTLSAHPPDTAFVLVSRSGDTIEIVRLLDVLAGGRRTVIGITNEPASTLAQRADTTVLVGSPRDEIIAVQTCTGTVLAMNLLVDALDGKLTDPGRRRELKAIPDLLSRTLERYGVADAAGGGPGPGWEVPGSAGSQNVLYLLARGASLASAHAGALIYHEMARFPAIAAGAGHFRHGPWEVVDERFDGFVLAPADGTYDLNVALAEELARLGGRVRLITPRRPRTAGDAIEVWQVPEVDPFLAPLLEIPLLQLAAYRCALARGLKPGQFRASLPVTLAETGSKLSGSAPTG